MTSEQLPSVEDLYAKRQQFGAPCGHPFEWQARVQAPGDFSNELAVEFCRKAALLGLKPESDQHAGRERRGYSVEAPAANIAGSTVLEPLFVDCDDVSIVTGRTAISGPYAPLETLESRGAGLDSLWTGLPRALADALSMKHWPLA